MVTQCQAGRLTVGPVKVIEGPEIHIRDNIAVHHQEGFRLPDIGGVAYRAARAEDRRFVTRHDGCGIRLSMKEVFDPLVQVVGIDNDGVGTRRDQTPDHDIQQGLPV